MTDPPKSSHLSALAPRLMLVDDDPVVLRGLRRLIRASHPQWSLLEAEDGEEALRLFELHAIHTVIADLQMPRMDGKTLLGFVAQRYPTTLRVVHSSSVIQAERAVLADLAHARIPKPANPTSLISVLDWALGGGYAARNGGACA